MMMMKMILLCFSSCCLCFFTLSFERRKNVKVVCAVSLHADNRLIIFKAFAHEVLVDVDDIQEHKIDDVNGPPFIFLLFLSEHEVVKKLSCPSPCYMRPLLFSSLPSAKNVLLFSVHLLQLRMGLVEHIGLVP